MLHVKKKFFGDQANKVERRTDFITIFDQNTGNTQYSLRRTVRFATDNRKKN